MNIWTTHLLPCCACGSSFLLACCQNASSYLSYIYHNLLGDRYRLRYIYGMRAPFGGDSVYARMNVWTYEPIKKGLTADFVCVYAILTELSLRETLESVVIKLKRNSIVMVLIVRSCPLCSNETHPFCLIKHFFLIDLIPITFQKLVPN